MSMGEGGEGGDGTADRGAAGEGAPSTKIPYQDRTSLGGLGSALMGLFCTHIPTCATLSQHDTLFLGSRSAEGIKHDSGKTPLELLAFDALEGCGAVLQFGAKKYAPRNWEKGLSWSRLVGAILRHTFEFMQGRDVDPETGLPVVDHILCEAMFLSAMFRRRKDLDDRAGK